MRDEVPTGTVVSVIKQVGEYKDQSAIYSNQYLEAMARDYAERIMNIATVRSNNAT
jgi:hypothetical protein